MTLFDKLKAHVGGLVLIKTELYWYKVGKWDGVHERVYLLLDALDTSYATITDDRVQPEATTHSVTSPILDAAVLLFIDGTPKWVWIYSETAELIK